MIAIVFTMLKCCQSVTAWQATGMSETTISGLGGEQRVPDRGCPWGKVMKGDGVNSLTGA